jgi:hypothetical protein
MHTKFYWENLNVTDTFGDLDVDGMISYWNLNKLLMKV